MTIKKRGPGEYRVHRRTFVACSLMVVAACSSALVEPPSAATLFEGARLIIGDESAPIKDSGRERPSDSRLRIR